MADNPILKKFGNVIRTLREKEGISQEELSFKSGLHRTYIGSVERGERNIALVNIDKLAKAFNCSLSDLITLMEENHEKHIRK